MGRLFLYLFRALLLHCPHCGKGGIFNHFFSQKQVCPNCGLWLEREPGYYSGAMGINLIVSELLFTAGFVLLLVMTWPNPPWTWLQWGGAASMVIAPILLWPFSRTLWLATDLAIHPVEEEDVLPGYTPSN